MKLAARFGVAVALFATAMDVGSAQEPAFRRDTQLVRLDVSVLDSTKQPVRDLTAADFQVTERGKRLNVRAFQVLDVAAAGAVSNPNRLNAGQVASSSPAARSGAADSSDVTAINPGRLIVLVMDDGMTPTEPRWIRQAKDIARAIVEGMGPNDRIALQFTRAGRTRLDLTMDRAALVAQIETFDAGGFLALPPIVMPGVLGSMPDEVPRFWRTMWTLQYTVDALTALTDRQKVVAYLGTGLPVDQKTPNDLVPAMVALFRSAERGNVVVYTFDPTGLDTLYGYAYDKARLAARMTPRLAGERTPMVNMMASAAELASSIATWSNEFSASVAESTGGRALVRSDVFEPAVAQMFADTGFYYLIAVDPPAATPDGKFHEVTVKVNRPNVTVHARRGYFYDR